eukprot:gnl/TRDRNA2_/TRDRNA2_197308_c0_seq1.p1 gnl/TRDRNA2_/TRDRNA2_197308_c0~~gnl/TRDRNA2_/TRDRNA2_197308_c0_seq1.p1  ORF type:complete len:239 (-),score=32.98 gnl/TRDRNA2_/TRDRNA2_197308_c0_seq1:92-808(-)
MPLSGKDTMNVVFMLTSTGLLTIGPILTTGLGHTFTYHPVFMSIGFALILSLGFWMYNYEDLPGEWIDTRPGRRQTHGVLQSTGAVLIVLGYAAVVRAHRQDDDAALFSVTDTEWSFTGPTIVRMLHIIVGYTALTLLPVQVCIGVLKYRVLTDDEDGNDEAWSIHELIGNALFSSGIINILLGVWLWRGWSLPVKAAITLTLITSLTFGPRWDGSKGFLSGDDAPEEGAAPAKATRQ